MIRSRLLRALSLAACALALVRSPSSTKRRTIHASSRTYLDDRYAHWRADVEAYEALEEPLVRVDESPGAGPVSYTHLTLPTKRIV